MRTICWFGIIAVLVAGCGRKASVAVEEKTTKSSKPEDLLLGTWEGKIGKRDAKMAFREKGVGSCGERPVAARTVRKAAGSWSAC